MSGRIFLLSIGMVSWRLWSENTLCVLNVWERGSRHDSTTPSFSFQNITFVLYISNLLLPKRMQKELVLNPRIEPALFDTSLDGGCPGLLFPEGDRQSLEQASLPLSHVRPGGGCLLCFLTGRAFSLGRQ